MTTYYVLKFKKHYIYEEDGEIYLEYDIHKASLYNNESAYYMIERLADLDMFVELIGYNKEYYNV